MSSGIIDKIKRFITMESEEIEFNPESVVMEAPEENGTYQRERISAVTSTVSPIPRATRKEEVMVFQPITYSEAQQVAEHIKAKKIVIVNMKKTDKDLAKRIIDFLSGINYAVDGNTQKIADNIFLFTPNHISITMVMEGENTYEDPLFNKSV